jgi:hypothetical protein
MELNARILLLAYMVINSLGYQLHSTFKQLQAIIMYTYIKSNQIKSNIYFRLSNINTRLMVRV